MYTVGCVLEQEMEVLRVLCEVVKKNKKSYHAFEGHFFSKQMAVFSLLFLCFIRNFPQGYGVASGEKVAN